MASIDIYTLLEANARLSRENKELVRLVRLLSQTVREMGVAAEMCGDNMSSEAGKYRTMPKGFLIAMLQNLEVVRRMVRNGKQGADNVDHSMDKFVGDDEMISKAYYESLIDELTRLNNKKTKQAQNDIDMWMHGFLGPDGKVHFNKPTDPTQAEFYEKHKGDINKFINDQINKLFKIDPKNFGGDIEGEWQDGVEPEGGSD